MGSQLYGGSPGSGLAGSMAAEIDAAFTALRAQAGTHPASGFPTIGVKPSP